MLALIPLLKKPLKINMFNCCNNEDNTKVTKEKMIDWIVETWDDSKVITNEIIFKRFIYTGIETV